MAESQNIEYKESWKDDYPKWICSHANASVGRIYVGVRDDIYSTLKSVLTDS